MKNVVIFTDNNESQVFNILKNEDGYAVRVQNIEELKNAEKFNPALIVLDSSIHKVQEVAMQTSSK